MPDVEQWRPEVAKFGLDRNGVTEVADIMEVELPVSELRVRSEKGYQKLKDPQQSERSSGQAQEQLHMSILSPGQVQGHTYATGTTSIEKEMSLSDALKLRGFRRLEFTSLEKSKGDTHFQDQVSYAIVEPSPPSTLISYEPVPAKSVAPSRALISVDQESSDARKRLRENSVDASNKRERITSKGSSLKDSTEHLDWFEAEYNRSLRAVASTNDSIRLDPKIAGEKYVPDWAIANKDTVVAPDLAKSFVYNLSTPTDYLRCRRMGDSDFSDLAMVNQAQSNLITSELHRRWVEAVVEIKKLNLQHKQETENLQIRLTEVAKAKATLANAKVALEGMNLTAVAQGNGFQTRIDDLTESYEKQTKMYAELAADHARLLDAEREWQEKVATLKKNLSNIEDKIIRDVEAHVTEVHSLRDTITTLEQQKRWLLTTGVQHFSHKIRTSPEMVTAVAAVSNATNLCGFVKGIQAGYHYALEAKIPMESVPDLPQNVEQKLNLAVSEFDNLVVPFVTTLAAHVESPFEEIQALLQAPTPPPNA